jgi:hypothetical protein
LKHDRLYDSNIIIHEVIKEDGFEVAGDEVAGLSDFHTILSFGEFILNQEGIEDVWRTKTAKTAIGSKADKSTILVHVEQDEDSAGVTIKELANIMIELGCVRAEYTTLSFVQLDQEEVEAVQEEVTEETDDKPKRKRK